MKSLWIAVLCCASAGAGFAQNRRLGDSWGHYSLGERFLREHNYQAAANEFREALNGDLQPKWIEVWSHINLGKIFALTGQTERAVREYQFALDSTDNTRGALGEAGKDLLELLRATPSISLLPQPGIANIPNPRVSAVADLVQPVQQSEPEYSGEGRLAGLEGRVVLSAYIAEDGTARDVRVSAPLGLGLDERAIEVVKQSRFSVPDRRVPVSVGVDFTLPLKQSRWHLVRVQFRTPPGASRPVFARTTYPPGPGISREAMDQGQVVVALRRTGTATLRFDIDESGNPGNFSLLNSSYELWGKEAMSLVRQWQFLPGMKDGRPIPVQCTVSLAWGEKNITASGLAQLAALTNPQKSGPATAILSRPEPSYSEEALRARLEGVVVLSLVVGDDGAPRDLRVEKLLGLGLDEKAIEAVSQWRFQPVAGDGRTSDRTAVGVVFQLPGGASEAFKKRK